MDGASLYPEGFHPVQTNGFPGIDHRAKFIPRLAAWPPVKYYYVDFGISVLIPPEVQPRHVVGAFGLDREVPELSFTQPYDPFKVDIFIIGNVFRRRIYAVRLYLCTCILSLILQIRNSQIWNFCRRWRLP